MKKRRKKNKNHQSTEAAGEQAGGSGDGDGGGAMLPGSAHEAPAHPAGLPNPDAKQGSKGSGKQTTPAESGTVHS